VTAPPTSPSCAPTRRVRPGGLRPHRVPRHRPTRHGRRRATFAAAGFEADLAAYDAAPDRDTQKLAISEGFIDKLCALGDPESVRTVLGRHLDAGATEVILTAVWGTDFEPALEAAAPMARS